MGGGPPGTGVGSGNGQSAPGAACTNDEDDTTVPSSIAPASTGALVDGVLCGTAAATAGLASGDVITAVDARAVTTPGSLTGHDVRAPPGH